MAFERSYMSNEEEDTRALAQEVGKRGVAQLEASLTRMMGEASVTSRWVLATLVALNGGGIAVMAGLHGRIAAEAVESGTVFFAFGAFLSVLAALASTLAPVILGKQIGEASALWTQVAVTGELGDGALKASAKVRRNGLYWTAGTSITGLVALLLFIGGAMTLSSAMAPGAPVADAAAIAAPVEPAQNATAPPPERPPAEQAEPQAAAKPEPTPPASPPLAAKAAPAPKPAPQAKAPPKLPSTPTPRATPPQKTAPAATPSSNAAPPAGQTPAEQLRSLPPSRDPALATPAPSPEPSQTPPVTPPLPAGTLPPQD